MAGQIPQNFRRVVLAAAVGNVIEWYDFYIFGSLAAVLSVKFFDKTNPVAALLSTIALFTAGFLVRPLGAFLFGWLGDRVGRKYTFIVTLSGMGLGTAAIGLIPTYASIGVSAAFILFGLRMLQGLCLGGEYGGAITYVAEHVPDERRGYYTGWLQTSPTLGIVVSLAVIVGTRGYLGKDDFQAWGWRIPFLISFLLVMMAIYIRLQLGETPVFQEMKARGAMVRNPWKEAFLSSNIKFILVAIAVLIGQGVVWYSGQFWALYFLQTVKKLDVLTSSYIVGAAPAAAGGDSGLPGDEGPGRDGAQPVERGVPELQHQIHPGRHRGSDRPGRRVVQRPVLGPVLPADGEEARRADLELHRRRGPAHRLPDVDPVRMALRHHRPQAGHSRGHAARSGDVLPAVCVAW